jgi:hypothetical protein
MVMSANPSIGRVQLHQETKSTEEQVKFESHDNTFFDIRGTVHIDWVPEGQSVNQVCYKKVLTTLRERVRRKRPEMWKNGSWMSHEPCQHSGTQRTVCQDVSGEAQDPVLKQPPYSSDLSPCDFFYFQRSSLH